MEALLIFAAITNFLMMAAAAYLYGQIRYSREAMYKASRDLESERNLLAEEMKKLSGLSHEIGSNWKALNDKVVTVENKLVAIQANLQATTMNSFRSPGR